jgi:hypothetical protein
VLLAGCGRPPQRAPERQKKLDTSKPLKASAMSGYGRHRTVAVSASRAAPSVQDGHPLINSRNSALPSSNVDAQVWINDTKFHNDRISNV